MSEAFIEASSCMINIFPWLPTIALIAVIVILLGIIILVEYTCSKHNGKRK